MGEDAKFEDGVQKPLRLQALDTEDVQVVSALLQDAVFPMAEMSWQPGKRRFALLLNRFRWEDQDEATRQGRRFERTRAMLVVNSVLKVASNGIDRTQKDMILSLLSLSFEPTENGAGRLELTLAGDGGIALEVECLDLTLQDVTRPYNAPSGREPHHPD